MKPLNKQIKFIWDFRGPDAKSIAAHHCIHLKEYAEKEGLSQDLVNDEAINEYHHIAFLIVDEANMIQHRDALKPHRGQIYSPQK